MFYEATVVLSGASNCSTCFAKNDTNFRTIVTPMKLKFLKYWETIPMIYSYAFILLESFVMCLNYLLKILESTILCTMVMLKMRCPDCLASMRTNLVVQLGLKGFQCPQLVLVRKAGMG